MLALTVLGACAFAGSAAAATVDEIVVPPGTTGVSPSSPEFNPQVLNVQPTDQILWAAVNGNTGVFSGPPTTLQFVNPATCGAGSAPPALGPTFAPPANTALATPLTGTANGTYYFIDPTMGGCAPGTPGASGTFASPSALPPNAGELIVGAPSSGGTGTGTTPSPASLTATVNVAQQFKSLTLSTNSAAFSSCSGGSSSGSTLGFPNGSCSTAGFNITNNGTIPESISVQGSNAIPSDSGTPWTLIAPGSTPGLNQFQLKNQGGYLGTAVAADNAAGTLQPNGVVGESLQLIGPSSSSDASSTFKTTATWTAS